jgi:hypothetical protein
MSGGLVEGGKSLGAILCGCADVQRLSLPLHVLFGYFLQRLLRTKKFQGKWSHLHRTPSISKKKVVHKRFKTVSARTSNF